MPDATASPTPGPRTAVVVVAAGSGSRVGAATNKVLLPLHGIPVLAWSLRTVTALPYVDHVVVVAREEDVDAVQDLAARHLPEGREALLVTGGPTRHASEWRGLSALRGPIQATTGRGRSPARHCSTRWCAPPTSTAAPCRPVHSPAWSAATAAGT